MNNAEQMISKKFLEFVNASPSPFHCVESARKLLTKAGFVSLSERNPKDWENIKPNGKYFLTRNQSSLVAFAVGGAWRPGQGFTAMAAHTDSPVPRVKPISKRAGSGYLQVGVELYGGGLWQTWFDRDLSVAGRVIVADDTRTKFENKLVRIEKPILRIPMLAIHLNRTIYSDGFKPNKETETLPILATAVKAQLDKPVGKKGEGEEKDAGEPEPTKEVDEHHSVLLDLISKEIGCKPENICGMELSLYDTQPACIGGALDEFIFSPRLDNQMMSFVTIQSLIDSLNTLEKEETIRVVSLFDNEEVGSQSNRGADSRLLLSVFERLTNGPVDSAMQRSILISADMAHAVHPNYAAKYESKHEPYMHKGLVVKFNGNERYATTRVSSFFLEEIARRHEIPIQKMVNRNDMPCGSTVGPMLSANCGVRTVDVGIPQLAMHSVREMCGTNDVLTSTQLLTHFFNEFSELDSKLTVD